MKKLLFYILPVLIFQLPVYSQSLDDLLDIGQASENEDYAQQAVESSTEQQAQSEKLETEQLETMLRHENPADLFEQIISDMETVSSQLNTGNVSLEAQREQNEIVKKLDQIIAQVKQQQSQKGKSGQNSKQQQANQDRAGQNQAKQQQGKSQSNKQSSKLSSLGQNSGQAGSVQVDESQVKSELKEKRSEWGHLPERTRKEIQEGMKETFSAKYRKLTEKYYEQLANQRYKTKDK